MKTIEVYDRKNKRTDVHLVIDKYLYNGDTLVLIKDGDVLRTYLPDEFTGFKVNVAPISLTHNTTRVPR